MYTNAAFAVNIPLQPKWIGDKNQVRESKKKKKMKWKHSRYWKRQLRKSRDTSRETEVQWETAVNIPLSSLSSSLACHTCLLTTITTARFGRIRRLLSLKLQSPTWYGPDPLSDSVVRLGRNSSLNDTRFHWSASLSSRGNWSYRATESNSGSGPPNSL